MTQDEWHDLPEPAGRQRRHRGVSVRVRQMVIARAGGMCERCGSGSSYGWSVHHRQPRGLGGSRQAHINEASNLLLLCGSGTTGCHGWVESRRSEAVATGFLVPRPARPEECPIHYRQADWRLLDRLGGWTSWQPDGV